MVQTIGNPLSWGADRAAAMGRHLGHVGEALGGHELAAVPRIRRLTYDDLGLALRRGWDDVMHFRSDVAVICLIYPVIGAVLAWAAFQNNLLPLIFPLISGFAILGPVAAIGLYEMSRRREMGQTAGWADAFAVLRSPSFGAIFVLGMFLLALFGVWIFVAAGIYEATMGSAPPPSARAFAHDVFSTREGHLLIVLGLASGFCFAAVALVVSIASFPLLLDRDVGLPLAVVTSWRVARRNPGPVAAWGLIVAAGLALGALPALLGLILVMPVLGHATWHLYRRAVMV